VDSDIDEGAERGHVRHDTLKNHAGLQILELLHPLAEAHCLENRTRIASGFLKFPQDVAQDHFRTVGSGGSETQDHRSAFIR
jgi:hypothetical protein